MEIQTIVIWPKGSITNRISIMVSAVVMAQHLNMGIKLIWDHDVLYENLFMGNIEIVDIQYFGGKKYVFNPDVDQSALCNNVAFKEGCDTYLIVNTDKEIKLEGMSQALYIVKRREYYLNILKEYMSGMLLGQINLVEFPRGPFCCVDGKFPSEIQQFTINPGVFDINNEEVKEYVNVLIYSKAALLVSTENVVNKEFVCASRISTVPVVHTRDVEYEDDLTNNFTKSFLDYRLVINPDIKKISLL
ncbi:hypothetical protein QKU58_gp034 [Pyramimonas orientalis virus]|uniref:Uncharacterized protein n=1 Tax=Pyramimonas orientalis virus 01B TaxID=3134525 RepID=A0A7M3UNM8_9VIRU|nr:hypothetical protein QKU58_gp034 [Pyramimonas orientalis virus]QOI90297.1 hypothetical protein HWQ62_00160 [Pyramimonas orientalis virus]